jgi:hypothetical protein
VVVEVTYGIFLEDYRRCGVLEFGHWRVRHPGFLSFALDSGRRATGPISCDRPLRAAGKRPDSHYRSSRDEASEPESSWRSDLLGVISAILRISNASRFARSRRRSRARSARAMRVAARRFSSILR